MCHRRNAYGDGDLVRPILADEPLAALFGASAGSLEAQPDIERIVSRAVTAAEKFRVLGPYVCHPQAEVRMTAIRHCIDVDAFGFNLLLTTRLLDADPRVQRYAALALWSRLGSSGCEYALRTIRQWCDQAAAPTYASPLSREEARTVVSRLRRAAPGRSQRELMDHKINQIFRGAL